MIDQDKMDAVKPTQVAVSEQKNELLAPGASDYIACDSNSNWKRAYAPLFESRGSAILKAALKERNKVRLNKLPPKEPVPPSSFELKARRVAQQFSELKNRKRSPKNSVIFTDPVVTQQYEYEPDVEPFVNIIVAEDNGSDEMTDDMVAQYEEFRRENIDNLSADDGDDDDNDIFTLAQSDDFDVDVPDEDLEEQKGAIKRTYDDLVKDSDDEPACDSPPGQTDSVSGGLFSSPKVAKIAPYFDDRPHERRAAEARAMLQNRHKSSKGNLRSRSIPYRNGLAGDSDSFLLRRKDSTTFRSQNRATQLLSYKKVSSPKVNENVINPPQPAEDSDSCLGDQPSGYFSWLTSFLTNQMNKLIF